MKKNEPRTGLTRRSFIKRSVVATVALSSLTIFSGLVNAGGTSETGYCSFHTEKKKKEVDGTTRQGYECWMNNTPLLKDRCTETGGCGTIPYYESDGVIIKTTESVNVTCGCTKVWCQHLSADWKPKEEE